MIIFTANVLKELLEDVGGVVFAKDITKADPSMTLLELWVSEYQESNAVIINPSLLPIIEKVARRERCHADAVGIAYSLGDVRKLF